MGPCTLRNAIRDSPSVDRFCVLRRFGPLLVKTKTNFYGSWFAFQDEEGGIVQQRTVLLKLLLGPQEEVVQQCDMQRLPPTRMIVTWYPARATGFSTSKPGQDDASSTHLQECLSIYAADKREEFTLGQQRPQPTVDSGLSLGVFKEPVRDSRVST